MKTSSTTTYGGSTTPEAAQAGASTKGLSVMECPGSTLFNVKKILVPVDFSACSKKALTYAVQFAREFGATLDVIYVVAPYYSGDPYGFTDFEPIDKQMRASGEQRVAALVLEQVPQGIPVETYVRVGRPASVIAEVAKELDADLIIVATHGHTGLKHVLMGSTAEHVVRHAPCPVLTVREKEHEFIA